MSGPGSHVRLTDIPVEIAPDGSGFRRLLVGQRAQIGHCELSPGQVTRAVEHPAVEELWYVVSGTGQLWRAAGRSQSVIDLEPRLAVTLPAGVSFQFRAGDAGLALLIVTAPPWPGDDAARHVSGPW